MSDSSISVQKSFEKSIKFGEKEPKEEVFSDDEPVRKRRKKSANFDNFQDSSVISEIWKKCENSRNMVEEMGYWMKKLEKLHDEDIDFLKKSINDSIGNLEKKFAEKLEKIDKTEDINSLKKSINDLPAILEQKITEKSEEGHKKLKQEFAEKMENIEKFYQEKIDNLSRENSKILKNCQEKIDRMEKIWESKIPKLESLELAEREPRNSHFRGPNPPGNPWEQGGYNQQMGPQPPQMMQMGPPPPMMMMYQHQQWQMGPQMGQFQQFNRYYGPY